MRGFKPATRYHDGLKSVSLKPGSRPPRPGPHAHPVHDLVRPDPQELPFLDLDLADALHARAKLLDAALGGGLDAEVVATLLHLRHRGDLLNHQRQRVVRHAREREVAAL